MRISHPLSSLRVLSPSAIHDKKIFILAGPQHQTDHPLTGTGVFQRRGIRTPAIKITGHLHFPNKRSKICKYDFLFLQRGKPFRNRLNCQPNLRSSSMGSPLGVAVFCDNWLCRSFGIRSAKRDDWMGVHNFGDIVVRPLMPAVR